jgi:hypothetical protein
MKHSNPSALVYSRVCCHCTRLHQLMRSPSSRSLCTRLPVLALCPSVSLAHAIHELEQSARLLFVEVGKPAARAASASCTTRYAMPPSYSVRRSLGPNLRWLPTPPGSKDANPSVIVVSALLELMGRGAETLASRPDSTTDVTSRVRIHCSEASSTGGTQANIANPPRKSIRYSSGN